MWLREGAAKLLRAGCAERDRQAYDVAFLTFTEPAHATLDLPAYRSRMKATVRRLRSEHGIGAWACSTEFQKRGALHPHMLVHWPRETLPLLRPHGVRKRDRAQYRWHFKQLVPMARELGWGPVCDAEWVEASTEAAAYATKSLASYATKQAYKRFKEVGAQRVRPIGHSRDWAGRLRDLQQGSLAVDEGPWVDVTQMCARLP